MTHCIDDVRLLFASEGNDKMWDDFLKTVADINSFINGLVWGWPMIILILGTGVLLTFRTRCLQVRKFGDSLNSTIVPAVKSIGKKRRKDERVRSVSQFEAFSTAISGTVGTGNIVGVVSAILTGGPGAVFWMWVSAFFGMVTNYSENVLGLYFRKKDKNGNISGGAFYYIYYGLKWRWLAYTAAVFCIFAAVGMSGVQTNKISGTVNEAFIRSGVSDGGMTIRLMTGGIVAVITAIVIIGGIQRIGKVASMLVPFMSLIFIALSLTSICIHFTNIPQTFALIFEKAFNFQAVGGGILGYTFAEVIKKGMARGVFSNEAGLGSSVIAHSASETREPVKQGLWGVFEVFFDTFIICTLTSLMFLTNFDVEKLDSGAWSYYGEKAVEFCFGWVSAKKRRYIVTGFKVIYVVLIAASTIIQSELIWAIDDTFNGLMAIPNLICVIALSGLVAKITKNYYDRKKGKDIEPMLSAYPELNEEFKQDITSGDKEMQ